MEKILEKLQQLLAIPSVVRFEQPLLDYLEDFCMKLPDYDIEQTDRLLVVRKKNSSSNKLVSAHIDRHGLVYNKENKLVYAAFEAEDYYEDEIEAEESVFEKVTARFIGEEVYAYEPVTGEELSKGKITGAKYDFDKKDVYFTVQGLTPLKENTPLALVSKLHHHKEYFSSQIDNSVSVAVAMQLLEEGFDGTVIFTTEEEIGRSWKHLEDYLLDNHMETQELIVLDTSPYRYIHSIDKGLVVLRNRDETGIFNEELVKEIREICENENIPFEFKDEVIAELNKQLEEQGLDPKKYGHTELGRLVEHTKGKLNGVTIQLPSTNYHTNDELSSKHALKNYYLLLKKLLL